MYASTIGEKNKNRIGYLSVRLMCMQTINGINDSV